jgi:hypothetical protein
MQLINPDPTTLAGLSGFFQSVEELRQRHELPELYSLGGFDLNQYQRLYDSGNLHCAAAISAEGRLLGWGLLTVVKIPRRTLPLCSTDVMWAKNPRAGAAVLRRLLAITENYGAPLLITARTGGRLDSQLARSRHARQTHTVYIYDRNPSDEH